MARANPCGSAGGLLLPAAPPRSRSRVLANVDQGEGVRRQQFCDDRREEVGGLMQAVVEPGVVRLATLLNGARRRSPKSMPWNRARTQAQKRCAS